MLKHVEWLKIVPGHWKWTKTGVNFSEKGNVVIFRRLAKLSIIYFIVHNNSARGRGLRGPT